MITIRVSDKVKDFLQKAAQKDHRSLTSYLVHSAIKYAEDHLSLDFEEDEK